MGVYYAVVALLAVTTLSVIDVTHGAAINGKTSAQQLMDAIPVEGKMRRRHTILRCFIQHPNIFASHCCFSFSFTNL